MSVFEISQFENGGVRGTRSDAVVTSWFEVMRRLQFRLHCVDGDELSLWKRSKSLLRSRFQSFLLYAAGGSKVTLPRPAFFTAYIARSAAVIISWTDSGGG
jgi:hypothetical protein